MFQLLQRPTCPLLRDSSEPKCLSLIINHCKPFSGRDICPETVVILHREQTRPEAVMEDFRNFGQRFSAADFSHRQMGASCTFVCRKTFRHTKGARSARLGGVPESRHLNYQIDDNHEKEDRTPDNDRSQSPQV